MKPVRSKGLDARWAHQNGQWRDSAQIAALWREAADTDPQLLRYRVRGHWWETLAAHNVTLLVTREYEHLVMAMCVMEGKPAVSYMPMPHPSGLAIDYTRGIVHVASTRNPNQVIDLVVVNQSMERSDVRASAREDRPLVPMRSRFLPGSLYLHDLAVIGGSLHAAAVGQNAIVRILDSGQFERVWWPRCIETPKGPIFSRNHLQLNSIAAGTDIAKSYFSASTDKVSARRPGHLNFPVKKRGVVFSGATREPVARGLTRPHSARLREGVLWVDNSGYGELGRVEGGRFEPVMRLPGWTRGLCFKDRVAFVGTSRVIPRFSEYAPGVDIDKSVCGVHAMDTATGQVLGSIIWPLGNQVFAIDSTSSQVTTGFPFYAGAKRATAREKLLFYAYAMDGSGGA